MGVRDDEVEEALAFADIVHPDWSVGILAAEVRRLEAELAKVREESAKCPYCKPRAVRKRIKRDARAKAEEGKG